MGHSIFMVASECAPFSKTGGLGDVIRGLSVHLQRTGNNVTVFLPFYRSVREQNLHLQPVYGPVRVVIGDRSVEGVFLSYKNADGVHYVFLDQPELFDRNGIYGDPKTCKDYADNDLRFGFFCRAALAYCKSLKKPPKILHGHDWQAGLAVAACRLDEDPFFEKTATVMTIHNLAYQGLFPKERLSFFGLPARSFQEDGVDFFGDISLLKAGIAYADAISTVSGNYAVEIQGDEFGFGFQDLLKKRADRLFGILNGVEYDQWSPEKDPYLAANYSAEDLSGKAKCKEDLLKVFGLGPELMKAPLFGVVSRLVEQKGTDFIVEILPDLTAHGGALVVLGQGDPEIEKLLARQALAHPDQVRVKIDYSEELAHKVEAGADFFLMPSRFEPCGLNQMYSLRYGTPPIVRAVGGLADTVKEFSPKAGHGNGFRFGEATPEALLKAVAKALDVYSRDDWMDQARRNGMKEDFSWTRQVRKYSSLYRKVLGELSEPGDEAEGEQDCTPISS